MVKLSEDHQGSMSCKICGNDTRTITVKPGISYDHCPHCQFIQMEEAQRISFAEERRVYDLHENSLTNEGYVTMFRDFLASAVLPFKQNGLVLDFGSGPEPVLAQLIKRDYDFEIEVYDLHYQPDRIYLEKKYQVITATEVIEHLSNPKETFALFFELLEEGGILAVMTLFHHNDEKAFCTWRYRRDETHISFYSLKTLEVLAKISGFTMIYTDGKRLSTFRKPLVV